MKTVISQNDIVLCTLESSSQKTTESGFIYTPNEIPTYRVVSVGQKVIDYIPLKEGDIIRTTTKGSIFCLNDVDYYMFKAENIVGKIES